MPKKVCRFVCRFVPLTSVLLLLVAVTGCSAKVKEAYHLRRANHYYDAGQYDQAEIEYLNTLRNNPQNSRAFGRLGVIYFDEGRIPRAAFFLAKGSQLATNDLDLRLKLGLIYSGAGNFKEARDQANFILDRQPQDDEAPLLLAEAASPSTEIPAVRQRLQNLMRKGDRAALEVALGNLALREQDLKTAETDFLKAQSLDPKFAPMHTSLGILCLLTNNLKQAETHFKAAADLSPARSPRRMQYARFKIQAGDLSGARQALNEINQQAPDYVPALLALAEVSAAEKKYAESAEWLGKLMARDSDNYDAMLLSSQLALMQGKPAQAVAELERMVKVYTQGRPAAQAQYRLAQAYVANQDPAKGMSSLVRALNLETNFVEAALLMAQLQLKNGDVKTATAALERLRQNYPKLVPVQLLLADAYRIQDQIQEALTIYESLEKAYPQDPQIPLLKAAAFGQLKDYAAARAALERVLELAPDNLTALEQLVNLDLLEKHFAAAMARLNRAVEKNPKQVALRLLIAKVFLAQNNQPQAEATLQKAIDLDPQNQRAYLLLAQLYVDSKQNQKALAKLETAIAKDPKDTSALMLAGMVNETEKEYAKAAEYYEKLLLVDPQASAALNNLAYLDSAYLNRLDRAYELAQRARELNPNDPATADTLGWICLKKNAYPSALALLQESAARLPAEPEVQFHLGMAFYMTDDEVAARTALQRAVQISPTFLGSNECQICLSILAINPETAEATVRSKLEKRISDQPGDPVALARLAVIYQRSGNVEKAISAYETILQTLPNNLGAITNLVRLYTSNNLPKAYDLAKAAYKLAPYNSDVIHALGRLAYLSGDGKLAASLLQQAVQNQPDNPLLLFDYAQAAYRLGRISAAQAALQNARQLNLAAPQSAEAQRLLEMIELAAAPTQAVAAGAHIAEVLKAQPDYVPALFAQAVASTQKGDAATAEKTCERILALDQYHDFAPAQKQLAILYAADPAKLNQAYALAVKARETLPTDPLLGKTLGIILVQRGEFSRAVTTLKEAASELGSDAELFFYLGKAQFQLKNRTDSKASLQKALALNLSGNLAGAAKQMLAGLK